MDSRQPERSPLPTNLISDPEFRFNHVYVQGDLHGDIQIFFEFLQLCDIASFNRNDYKNPNIRWKTSRTRIAVIFVGDVVDRYRPGFAHSNDKGVKSSVGEEVFEEKYLERAINELSAQATSNGSLVIKLFGNHEFLNRLEPMKHPDGRLRLASEYDELAGPKRYLSPFLRRAYVTRYEDLNFMRSRINEFQPGHIMNIEVAQCNPAVIFQLNQHVFVHGGISRTSIEYAEKRGRHLYEFANTLARAVWSGTASHAEYDDFKNFVGGHRDKEGTLLWDRTFSTTRPGMPEYISAVIRRLNEHNARFHVPPVVGIVVAHTWPGESVSPDSSRRHLVCRKNGTDGAGYVIFTDTNASRSFINERSTSDEYQRKREPRDRVRPLHIFEDGSTETMLYDDRGVVTTSSVPL